MSKRGRLGCLLMLPAENRGFRLRHTVNGAGAPGNLQAWKEKKKKKGSFQKNNWYQFQAKTLSLYNSSFGVFIQKESENLNKGKQKKKNYKGKRNRKSRGNPQQEVSANPPSSSSVLKDLHASEGGARESFGISFCSRVHYWRRHWRIFPHVLHQKGQWKNWSLPTFSTLARGSKICNKQENQAPQETYIPLKILILIRSVHFCLRELEVSPCPQPKQRKCVFLRQIVRK